MIRKVLNAVKEELFPDGRQQPLGQSAGGHNDPLPQLQQVNNDNADNSKFATDENEAADDSDDEDNADADKESSEDSSDKYADNKINNASSNDMADPGGATAAGVGAGRTKPVISSFTGEGSNIFDKYPRTRIHLQFPRHAPITQERRHKNLDQCLTGVAKKWYCAETKLVGNFTDWNAFETNFADRFGIKLTPDARGTQAETLSIRDGKFCHNFIDRCRLYHYEFSQQARQTIARLLPTCHRCDGYEDCPPRDDKIKRITVAVSERECIDLII